MIRLVFLLRRQPHLSLAEFQERWRDEHGPLVASHQTRLRIARYTQTHRLDDAMDTQVVAERAQLEEPYDGVAELWWHSEEQMLEATGGGAGRRAAAALLADEQDFIDLPHSPLWLAHEYPQFSTSLGHVVARPMSGVVKAHFALRHRSDMTLQGAQHHWHTIHGPRVRSMAPILGMLKYQQVHRFETPIEAALRESRGTAVETYTGHTEMWMFLASCPEAAVLREQAVEDERQFIDFARSAMWIGEEHVFIDRW